MKRAGSLAGHVVKRDDDGDSGAEHAKTGRRLPAAGDGHE